MNPQISRAFKRLLILIILDFIIIWLLVINMGLDSSSAMGVFLVVPSIFFINLIIGGILFLVKRDYSYLFFINSVIASVIMNFLFTWGINYETKKIYDSWSFCENDTLYVIDRNIKYNEFSLSYRNNPGSSTEFIKGSTKFKGDTLLLGAASINMFIFKKRLYNFRNTKSSIQLKLIP